MREETRPGAHGAPRDSLLLATLRITTATTYWMIAHVTVPAPPRAAEPFLSRTSAPLPLPPPTACRYHLPAAHRFRFRGSSRVRS